MGERDEAAAAGADLDRWAAELRLAEEDIDRFLQVLAHKLSAALPAGAVTVKRAGRPWQPEPRPVARLEVNLPAGRWVGEKSGGGVQWEVAKVVRGITLKRETVSIRIWLARLLAALREAAEANEAARRALEQLLLGE